MVQASDHPMNQSTSHSPKSFAKIQPARTPSQNLRIIISWTLSSLRAGNAPDAMLPSNDHRGLFTVAATAIAQWEKVLQHRDDDWLPLLRVVRTMFDSANGLLVDIDTTVQIPHAHRVLRGKLGFIIDLIGKIFVAESVSSLDVVRFFIRLEDVVEDLLYAWKLVQPAPSQILEQWLQIIRSEKTHMSWHLPPTTPVFTCPFLLAGCSYRTIDFGEWITHKDICYKQHLGLIKSSVPTSLSSNSQELPSWDLTINHISAVLPAYLPAPRFSSDILWFECSAGSSFALRSEGLSFAPRLSSAGNLSASGLDLVTSFLFGLSMVIVAFSFYRRLMRKN